MKKRVEVTTCTMSALGHLRETSSGNLVVDFCAGDAEHIVAPVGPGGERRECQTRIDDAFRGLLGKKGLLQVTVHLVEVVED